MNAPIERRVEALEAVGKVKRRVGLVVGLEGETVKQALERLGLADDDEVLQIVLVPMKAQCRDDAGQ